jgi:FAD/FMN-containing dehydrogenase
MDNPAMVKNPGKLFELVRKLEETISGEHGIGLIRRFF